MPATSNTVRVAYDPMSLKERLFRRDQYTCQGCGDGPPTGYVRRKDVPASGHDFLWEFVSVCDECAGDYDELPS
jgi:hypothetical protein